MSNKSEMAFSEYMNFKKDDLKFMYPKTIKLPNTYYDHHFIILKVHNCFHSYVQWAKCFTKWHQHFFSATMSENPSYIYSAIYDLCDY